MTRVCEVLTADPPGSNARIKFDVFKEIYTYMGVEIEKSTSKKYVDEVCTYLQTEWA